MGGIAILRQPLESKQNSDTVVFRLVYPKLQGLEQRKGKEQSPQETPKQEGEGFYHRYRGFGQSPA